MIICVKSSCKNVSPVSAMISFKKNREFETRILLNPSTVYRNYQVHFNTVGSRNELETNASNV